MSSQEESKLLKKRIQELEKELRLQQEKAEPTGNTVSVPDKIKPLFDQAQKTVSEYFSHLKFDPAHGTIEIHDERYVLVRASALSSDFLATIKQLYADRGEEEAMTIGKNFLFDIAHVIGSNDARKFHDEMNLTDPIAKLAAGPVHFAYSGWAFVNIQPESTPTPDNDFYLKYDHPYSFEADSWLRAGRRATTSVCIMNAGYSSGWCEASFGIPLTAVEVSCRAKGDKTCTFIMSPPEKIEKHLERYRLQAPQLHNKKITYDIPAFFERKQLEEQLALYALIVESTEDAIMSLDLEENITSWNRSAQKLFGYPEQEVLGKPISILLPEDRQKEEQELIAKLKKGESINQFETERRCKDGRILPVSLTASALRNAQGEIIGFSKISHDISKRKAVETALRDLNNSLEKLVQERTADLQRAYDELETRVTFRNLELEKLNKANLANIEALEKQVAALKKKS